MSSKAGARAITEVDVSPLGSDSAEVCASETGEQELSVSISISSSAHARIDEPQAFFLDTMLATLPDNVFFKDAKGRFTRMSRHMASWLGLSDPAEALGKTDAAFFSTERATRSFVEDQEILRTGVPLVDVLDKERLPGGKTRWISTTKMPLRDQHGQVIGTFGFTRDVTDQRRLAEEVERHSLYDELSELPNRALFVNRVEHLFQRGKRQADRMAPFAVLYFDVDRFKAVNDSFGHRAGDALLVQVARRLERSLRPSDTLARLGGDDFAILLEDLRSTTDATRVAERIHANFGAPFTIEGMEIFCSASIGITSSASGYVQAQDMLRDANTAMYRAKANGRSGHQIFDPAMHKHAVSQLKIETDLRRAIERSELVVHYQPIVNIVDHTLKGFEALVRWNHPTRGLVPPGEFIPVAEETGLIGAIGHQVLEMSCRQLQAWRQAHPQAENLRVSVNLSARQLAEPNLVEQIRRVLHKTGLDPRALGVEITESALVRDMAAGAAILEQLRKLAVHIDIDDFGTGYSSLSYLQNLPVDTLKVDRSFVMTLDQEGGRSEIVRAIVDLAHNLRMTVIAEGVETKRQLEALAALGCNAAQGYYFSRPLPARDIEALIVNGLPAR